MDDWKLEPCPPAPATAPRDTRPLRWWFVRVTGIKDPEDLARARKWVSGVGRVWNEGHGTASSREAGWFVLRCRCESIREVRERLGPAHSVVDRIEEVPHRSHGVSLARQMPLIG